MTNEAVIIDLGHTTGSVQQYTIADTAFEQHTLMVKTDPSTMAASASDGQPFAGILVEEMEVNGQTTAGVYTAGKFDLTTADTTEAINVGEAVKISGANLIARADDDTAEGMMQVVGYSDEAAAADATEVIAVRLKNP